MRVEHLLPRELTVARRVDSFADACRRLSAPLGTEILPRHGPHGDPEIESIAERAGQSLLISRDGRWCAAAFALVVAVIAARTRIHCADQEHARREDG